MGSQGPDFSFPWSALMILKSGQVVYLLLCFPVYKMDLTQIICTFPVYVRYS